MLRCVFLHLAATLITVLLSVGIARADEAPCADAGVCGVELDDRAAPVNPTAARTEDSKPSLEFFWGVGCPHCAQAERFLQQLEADVPGIRVERYEVREDPGGRERFIATMKDLDIEAAGIPAFVVGRGAVIGFHEGRTEQEVRALLVAPGRRAPSDGLGRVQLPLVGEVDPRAMSLPAFTVLLGLLDGINPCAMWVLLVLLGILMHVKSRRRILLFGGTFVVLSGAIYFGFMTAWSLFFQLAGLSRAVTIGLGVVVIGMGLINLKELVWFKRGASLTIPDRAKPRLFRRMRAIATAASLPTAFLGILILAFVVNLIELGCTLGLPAIYTRVLSLRELPAGARYGYLTLYNVAYVVPLGAIVAAYALTMHRLVLSERNAKALKGVSGALLLAAGLVFVLRPEILY